MININEIEKIIINHLENDKRTIYYFDIFLKNGDELVECATKYEEVLLSLLLSLEETIIVDCYDCIKTFEDYMQ